MGANLSRIEVSFQEDARATVAKKAIERAGFGKIKAVSLNDVYTVSSSFSEKELKQCARLLHNPVTQGFSIGKALAPKDFDWAIEIGFLPGVTDNVGKTAAETIKDFFGEKARDLEVFSSSLLFLKGGFSESEAKEIGEMLANKLIQRIHVKSRQQFEESKGMDTIAPRVKLHEKPKPSLVDLDIGNEELAKLGKSGILDHVEEGTEIRRGPLALDLASLKAIREYFGKEGRKPTDIELESIAQTWSEHCKHTIFAAEMDDLKKGLFKGLIKAATEKVRKDKGEKDSCVSVFVDNSGAIEFGNDFMVSDKVETHNSPSALDPFGGAITGIVGVNRDTMGFGMAAKPIVNRYGFCFANPKDAKLLFRAKGKANPILQPERVMLGVIDGVQVGGNCSGIPTPAGFMYFDERYKGKPLVFVGTIGLMPQTVNGKPGHEKKAMPGDAIVMAGGRVGLDGIHGATFSSEALSSGSPATAVQIGDPITQKKMSDAIVKEARDLQLYNSITDNGAGGLSCSVAEMAKECGGCTVDLDKVPVKYPGMSPWQTWVSESQERMTLAIPKEKVEDFISLMKKRGVEATAIGEFNDSGRCVVKYNGESILDLDMDFLHEGLPKKRLFTKPLQSSLQKPSFECPNLGQALLEMVSRLNVCSKEFVSAQYDHEVQGSSVLKPLQGKGRANAEAAVVRPNLNSEKGIAISQALYPGYGDIDSYWMAAAAIDSAIKNLVAVGAKLKDIALLDNFCWCSSNEEERLWQLKNAARACYDFATAFGTPFISGKDSMFNDFKGFDEESNALKISVPPTLLISSLAVIADVEKCVSMDAKLEGDLVYALGLTKAELGASEYHRMQAEKAENKKAIGGTLPTVDAEKASKLYNALSKAIEKGLVASVQPIGLGGLGTALAKKCIAGRLGAKIDLQKLPAVGLARNDSLLFSESQSRFIATIAKENRKAFEKEMQGCDFAEIGLIEGKSLELTGLEGSKIASVPVQKLEEAYKKTLGGY